MKIIKDLAKQSKIERANDRKTKTYKGEWYTVNSILGNEWAIFFALLGGREAGKSYSVGKWAGKNKIEKGDKFKLYWMRLTDQQTKPLLEHGADRLLDPDIKRKYNLHLTTIGNTVYTYEEKTITKASGEVVTRKVNLKEYCTVLSCSTFYNSKGVGYFDNEYDGEYCLVLDEMNREQSEKNCFDIVYNFVNLCENLVRSTKKKIKIIMIGNTLSEASDILAAFNFIPNEFGRYKLKNKRCVIDYIKPSEEYLKRRKGTVADILLPGASTFTNEVELDSSLLVNKRKATKPQYIIKFTKEKATWYTVWNGNIVKPWNGENLPAIPMRKYLDEVYTSEGVNGVFDMFNSRTFLYTNIACFKRFQKELRLLKK